MRGTYREIAPLYDLMAGDPGIQAFYAEFQASIREAAKAHHIRPRVIVDLACGTGNTTVPWVAGFGRTVIGVDQSEAMLGIARGKSARVRWVRARTSSASGSNASPCTEVGDGWTTSIKAPVLRLA